ncbi:PAS domain S-box protein [Haloferax elongans]|uniref:PAS domain S-box protein n=1 Tax=Haloferax elongans TaxID=403191 RepID=UPI001F4CFD6C|nr:PAS domain S-box protein [Haloferax elongans]
MNSNPVDFDWPETQDVRSHRVTLLLGHRENRELLAEWIREETPHVPLVPDDGAASPVAEDGDISFTSADSDTSPFASADRDTNPYDSDGDRDIPRGDICIVDQRMVAQHREWVSAQKRAANREFYPVLLVHSDDERRLKQWIWSLVDEAIAAPIRIPVFERRLNNLLERRRLSVAHAREFRTAEHQYRALFEASNDAIVVFDPVRDVIQESNKRATELLGYSRAELRQLSPASLFSTDTDRYHAFVEATLDTGRGWTDDLVVTRRDGTEIVTEVSVSVIEFDDSPRLVASIRNVTERHSQKLELERRRDELDELHSINRTLRKTTQAVARASCRSELEQKVCEQLANSDRYEFAWIGTADEETGEIVPQTVAGDAPEYLESVTIRADDTPTGRGPAGTALRKGVVSIVQETQTDPAYEPWRHLATRYGVDAVAGVPIRHDDETYGVLTIYANEPNAFGEKERNVLADLGVTVGHAINALQAHRDAKRFEEAVEHAGHAIYIASGDGTIEYVNSAFEESTGYTREEVVGCHHSVLRTGEDNPSFHTELWESVSTGDTWQDETTGRRKDGRRQHIDQTVAPISTIGNEENYIVAVRMDITDERRRQQQLQTLHRVLRHNIRNELNVIRGYLDIVDEETPEGTAESAMSKIRSSTEELLRTSRQARRIEQTFVRSDDASESPAKQSFSSVVRAHCDLVRTRFSEATVEWSVPECGAAVDAEFGTALNEILTNALRHNDSAAPTVICEASVENTGATVTQAVVSVRDNGPGIPVHERRVLREGEETPLLHGSGLGLWLVNWILTELGGEVRIDDNDPRGTVVTMRLPLYDV